MYLLKVHKHIGKYSIVMRGKFGVLFLRLRRRSKVKFEFVERSVTVFLRLSIPSIVPSRLPTYLHFFPAVIVVHFCLFCIFQCLVAKE